MADVPEYKTLVGCASKISIAIQHNLAEISSHLLAANLISPDQLSLSRNVSLSESERASRLVSFIINKIQLEQRHYHVFINVLSDQSPLYDDLLQKLNETYSNLRGGVQRSSVSIDDIRQQHVRIMQLLDLSIILPLIKEKRIIPKEDYEKVADTKHHGTIERTGYLLHALYKQGQVAIDRFVQCLRETKAENPKHAEILQLFEGGLPDLPSRSPIFEILDQSLDDIERLIELMPFLNTLLEADVISVSKLMDLQSPDRPVKENLERLFRVLESQGTRGFIKFLSCLQKEGPGASTSHQQLFALLLEKVKGFLKDHPRRNEVQQSDRIELLHMRARDQLQEKRVCERFEEHRRQLEAEIQLSSLMPYLQKQHVLSAEDSEMLMEVEPERRNREVLEILVKKGPQLLVRFVECLEASPENKPLAALFSPSTETEPLSHQLLPLIPKRLPESLEKHDKVAVIVQVEQYAQLTEDYQLLEKPFGPRIAKVRGKLEQNLKLLGFNSILYFKPSSSFDEEEEEGQGVQVGAKFQRAKPRSLRDKFKEKVGEHCKEGAVVFIFVSGLQFPFPDRRTEGRSRLEGPGRFSAAILKDGATMTSRQEFECIRAKDLHLWAESLPNCHVTFLIDTHQSHVAQFGLQRTPEVAEIMDDPWSDLIVHHSTTVVYYLKPDPTAMALQLGITQERKEEGAELGMLTECFVNALLNCYKRTDSELSHRQVYEAVSLYWHLKGRKHLLFVPAIQGDIDREFLAKNVIPYRQFFHADLPVPVRGHDQQKYEFDLSQLKVPTGSMSGLILNDQVEVFHLLRPSVRASGRVARAQQLNCTVEVLEGNEKKKLQETLDTIYLDEDLRSKDGSTEFLCIVKKFPLHEKFPVYIEGLTTNDTETVKTYIKTKAVLLSFTTKRQDAALLLEPNGGFILIIDLQKQVKLEVRSRDAQHAKMYLEMMAWYKHCLRVLSSSPTKPLASEQKCFLSAEKPLLSSAPPLCDDFQMKWSTYVRATEDRQCRGAILSFVEPQRYWSPASPAVDTHPCLEVEFKKNHVITSIELRGDAKENKFVKQADIWCQRDAFQSEVELSKGNSESIDLSGVEEAVRFVTIVPLIWGEGTFDLTFRLKKRVMSGSKKSVVDVEHMSVLNWQFHHQRGTGWKCIPSPNANGVVVLSSAIGWMYWAGSTGDPITFDVRAGGLQLEKIEFTRENRLQKFLLRMQTDWKKEEKTLTMNSAWPTKYEFERPLVVSNLQVWPLETNIIPAMLKPGEAPPPSNVKLQMQLYGNKQNEALEVEEGDILSFHFNNYALQDFHVYIFCFEETGNVKFVTVDIAKHPYRVEEKKTVFPAMKKLLQAYIPQGYNSSLLQIRDHYKVLVSTRKMYLEPLIQRGLHDYRRICMYNVCSLGRRSDFGPEPWYEHSFDVVVKKSSRK